MELGRNAKLLRETNLVREGASFAAKYVGGRNFPFFWHYHPEIELTLIVKGRGLRYVGDSLHEYRDGDLCLLGSNLPHTWYSEPAGGESVSAIVIFIATHFFDDALPRVPELRPINQLLERARRGLRIGGKTRQQLAEQMLAFKRLTTPLAQFNSLLSMLTLLARSRDCSELSVASLEPLLSQHANRRVNLVFDYIHARLDEIPAQSEVAKIARLSPQAFSRFFKRSVGKRYVEYVNELRVGVACRKLLETDLNVTEIAFASGFENLSNFNRRFRALKGVTPRDYRRSLKA